MLEKGMDNLFKQKLLRLRQPLPATSFGEALYPNSLWQPTVHKETVKLKTLLPEQFSEKRQALESLERFAQEKALESSQTVIPVEGGEIALRAEPNWEGVSVFHDAGQLKKSLSVPSEFLELLFEKKTPGKVQVIFVTENFRDWNEVKAELKQGFLNELLAGFPLKTAELFERMILAMKLTAEEVFLYPVDWQGQDLAAEVMSIASYLNPEVIITLGAKATQKILKSNDRLSLVHGQFFFRKVSSQQGYQVVPLFHPSIIETNQNMKKTAWSDMQKIMKHLKKLT